MSSNTIKEDNVFGEGNEITSQVHDEIYREELQKYRKSKHYVFEFVDVQRSTSSSELKTARTKLNGLQGLEKKFVQYIANNDVQEFFNNLTPNEKQLIGLIEKSEEVLQQYTHEQIMTLFEKVTEGGSFDEPLLFTRVAISALETQLKKPTISVRISEGGEIGELKIVNIQSKEMTGNHLMQVFDKTCKLMGVEQMYLEDVAQIEKKDAGNYNLRLYRYFTTDDKTSWYTDSYNFKPYTRDASRDNIIVDADIRENDPVREKVNHFKMRNLDQVKSDLKKQGFDESKKNKFLAVLQIYDDDTCTTIPDLIKKLALEVRQGASVHRDMNTLLTTFLELYKDYTGSDLKLLKLKEHAKDVLGTISFRKSYQTL